MDDLISRQDVLELIEHYNSDALGTVFIDWKHGKKFEEEIKSLPSALNFPKIGKWEEIDIKDYKAKCSSCGTWSPIMGRYCPHCGARMIGEEE